MNFVVDVNFLMTLKKYIPFVLCFTSHNRGIVTYGNRVSSTPRLGIIIPSTVLNT
jgi:hypothetical protein